MKLLLSLSILLSVSSVYAFSTVDTFSCYNGDTIEVRSSLMPNGQRLAKTQSAKFGALSSTACKNVESEWKNFGTENCFFNQNALFSYYQETGTLKFKVNEQIMFTICRLVNSIQ